MQVNIYMYYISTFQGLEYIHKSAVKQHGNLKSSNCVIDSRWVCKLTDFGLQKLKTPLHLQVEEIGEHAAYARMYNMHCSDAITPLTLPLSKMITMWNWGNFVNPYKGNVLLH